MTTVLEEEYKKLGKTIVLLREEAYRAIAERDRYRKALEVELDACFCNGVNGELPDCDRCSRIRIALRVTSERKA